MGLLQSLRDQFQGLLKDQNTTPIVWILLIVIGVLPPLYLRWSASQTWHTEQRAHGCQKPNRYPRRSWRDRHLFLARQAARQAGQGMVFEENLYASLGHTWEETKPDGGRLVNVSNRANIQRVLGQDVNEFGKATGKIAAHHFLGAGAMVSNGSEWKRLRDRIKPIFAGAELRDLSMLEQHVDNLVALLPRDGSTVDMQPLLKRMFFDSLSEFIFGESANTLSNVENQQEAQELLASFDYALGTFLKRRRAGIFALAYGRDGDLVRASARSYGWIDGHVRRALQVVNDQKDGQTKSDRYVLLHELARNVKDVKLLRGEIMNVFTPGRDGVAVLVSNALFQLARHPKVWSDLRTASLALGRPLRVNFEQLSNLKPFRNVINETLRTLGPYGTQRRTALRNTILPCGGGADGEAPVALSAGDEVNVFTWSLHHDPDVFGPDPYDFKPDRWNDLPGQGWNFIPFSAGRRVCPSQRQSIVQAIYVLLRLTRVFESIENRDPVERYVERHIVIMESRNGVKVGLVPAAEPEGGK